MTTQNSPAFPTENAKQIGTNSWHYEGMTLRQYAAIKLKVPDSGDEWLNYMIRKSLLNDFAANIMPSAIKELWDMAKAEGKEHEKPVYELAAEFSYQSANAMLAAKESS